MPVTAEPGLYEYFERAAAAWPNVIAIDVPPAPGRPRRTVTYAELRRASEHWAAAADRGHVAAILLRRDSEHLYAAQLGVLRSAAAYVCIDPSFPDDQVAHILHDSKASVLLTDADGAARAARIGYQNPIVRADGPVAVPAYPPVPPGPDSVAYLVYTSGSTGRPKAVLVPQRGVVNLVEGDLAEFGLGPGDRVAQGSSAAYDSSVEEVWLALASGATVVVLDDDTARLGPDLVPWLRRERITVLCPPPTLLRTTGCENPREELPELRLLYVGGEALPDDIAERWSEGLSGDRRMVNGYGPTECTVTCLRQDIVPGRPVAIGRPVPGMRAWVLDEHLRPVPPGGEGELCLGGAGVALGYLNRPGLTAEKFPLHPEFGRIYRTGDLVHAEPDGTFFCHGRIDAQVKVRGHRIELEAIESCLARCPGVREAACRVQGEVLAAHLVPEDPECPPPVAGLRKRLRQALPEHMVPAVFGIAGELPRTAGGKLRRADLPALTVGRHRGPAARTPMERAIAAAVQTALSLAVDPAVDRDFFTDLGGSSLTAAMVVTRLRANPATAGITVRDLYQARTIAGLARLAGPASEPGPAQAERAHEEPAGNAIGATVVQSLWLAVELLAGSVAAYFVFFRLLPWASDHIGLIPLIFVTPVALTLGWTLLSPLSIAIAVRAKKVLIGRYVPMRASVWSGFGIRVWIVRQFMRLIPWERIAGTEFHCMVLRLLGARIGRRVHIHRGVDLSRGGWDLLDIGDDVSLGQDAAVRLVQLERRQLVLGPVTIAAGATLDVRAGVGPHTRVGRGAWLTALSSLPSGQAIPDGRRWDGVPARPAGAAPPPPAAMPGLPPIVQGLLLMLSRDLLQWALALPSVGASVLIAYRFGLTYRSLLDALAHPLANVPLLLTIGGSGCLSLMVTVGLEALACRLLGTISPGVIGRWSAAFVRVWLKTGLVSSAGRWLSGGLFWPVWLRVAGMKVGRGCEISTIIDVVPELVRIGPDSFFADGIYLGGPRVHRGAVTLAPVVVGANTFLGNHAVIAAGQQVPRDVLIGISTVADDRVLRPGTSWFGHPPFELPQREVITVDRSLTHAPPLPRVAARVVWEWLRFALPIVPMLAALGWAFGVQWLAGVLPAIPLVLLGVPMVTLAAVAALCLFVLALKWGLLARVRPGTHPLWSCWCSRWDFLYVAWGFVAARALSALEGTLLLALYLRRTGMKIGKRVVFGEGFAQIVDPDMLDIGDGATVSAMFQAHTFEDRVLKIDGIRVGAHATLGSATVPLYGADIGEHTEVAPHSVIMKREHLRPGRRYEGAPTREQRAAQDLRQPAAIA